VLALAAFDLGLETGIVVPALPVLAEHYDASIVGVTWLVTGFLLAATVAMPVLGRLGDLHGKRRVLLASLVAFASGSLLCALTTSSELAIAGRVVQGLGAATAAVTIGLLREGLSGERLPRAIGILVGANVAGAAIGLLLSGFILDHSSPTAIFWFLFGFAVLLVAGVLALVPESPVRQPVRVDIAGAAMLGSGLVAVLLAVSKGRAWGWDSWSILGLFAAAAVLLTFFALIERRVSQPLVDLRLLVAMPFRSANVCGLVYGLAFLNAVLLIPLLAGTPRESGYGLGLSTIEIGVVLFPTGAAAVVAGWLAGKVVDTVGPRVLVTSGAALGTGTYVWLALAHDSRTALTLACAVLGLGVGLTLTGIYAVVVRSASPEKTSIAVAVNIVVRNTAVTVGAQIAATIVASEAAGQFPADAGYTNAFYVSAVGAGLLIVAATLLPGRKSTAPSA
jgi:MFS family permease